MANSLNKVGFAPQPKLAHALPATQHFSFHLVESARVSSIGRSQVYERSVASPGSLAGRQIFSRGIRYAGSLQSFGAC